MQAKQTKRRSEAGRAGLGIETSLLKPGLRLAVGLSGGADSVALLRILVERGVDLGLVIHAAHLHHGLRGEEADQDLEFCRELAERLGVSFHEARVDTAAEARADAGSGKPAETIEEAARRLRYAWFQELMAAGEIDAVATAHTLDDQAETVLAKFLRGAWTEGLAGISPKLESPEGRVLRPMLGCKRVEVEAYLRGLGQEWREDSTNRQTSFTRNRIRHELLPLLEEWNPRLREHLAHMAELARDEEAWWEAELERVAPQMLLQGRPARGGGRAESGGLALDVTRLAALEPALQRRLLRLAAKRLGLRADFIATEALRRLALNRQAGRKLQLEGGLRAERTPRELRMEPGAGLAGKSGSAAEVSIKIPGEIHAPERGVWLRVEPAGDGQGQSTEHPGKTATLRNWRPGDRVRIRYSGGAKKVKEVLERMKITGNARTQWPVLEVEGRIVWMRGVAVEPGPERVTELQDAEAGRG
jgi:tRNA(Ile)-lysidine synthase